MRIRCWMRRLAALQSGFHSRFQIFWYMYLKGTALKESDLASLRTLGGQLGYLDVAMQKKTLDYYLEQVSDACAQAKKEYREKEKMFRCLGFGAGAFLVILLY